MERPKTVQGRKVGNTTRLIDYYIQELFESGHIRIWDHYTNGHHKEANSNLYERICNRLYKEHPGLYRYSLLTHEWIEGMNEITMRKE